MQDILSTELERFLGSSTRVNDVPEEPRVQENHAIGQVYNWQGGLHRLPEDYQLPSGTVGAAFRQWMLPDALNRVSALKSCTSQDFRTVNQKKRFSELSKLMKMIVAAQTEIPTNPSIQQIDRMVTCWEQQVELSATTPKGRVRRLGQLKWTTVLKLVNNMNKQ